VFSPELKSRAHYERRARRYDLANRISAFLRGTSPIRERRKAVKRLRLEAGHRVLEVSVGTGTNLPLIADKVGSDGQIVGLDISRGMLGVCVDRFRGHPFNAALIEGEAARLPFIDESFDAVFHHGGVAEFGDAATAMAEMYRVVKPGGWVVVCDVGVHRDGSTPLMNRFLMLFQPEYNKPPPIEGVPAGAEEVGLRWYFGRSWYMLSFTKPAGG
jgi:ubiquinone/menaquinone biosynthesis C-methylase UbiE